MAILAKATELMVEAWRDHQGFFSAHGQHGSFSAEAEMVSNFLDTLGVDNCSRLFSLKKYDFRHLTRDSGSEWQQFCLNKVRAKIAIHTKALIEALSYYDRLGYWKSRGIPSPRQHMDQLREIFTWMGLYSQNNLRQQQMSVRERRFDNAGEISSIDTELFTACNLVETSNCDTNKVLDSAYKIICQGLENNLFNVSVSAITDSSNLWWAVKLAVQNDGILNGIPGGAKEPLVKAVMTVHYQQRFVPSQENKSVS